MDWLRRYVEIPSPSGCEFEAQKFWSDSMRPYVNNVVIGQYYNSTATIENGDWSLMLESHADTVGWMVRRIDDDGFIYVSPIGGADPLATISTKASIITRSGLIPCVFGWPATHIRENFEPTEKSIFIDCGAPNREEVMALGIRIGDYVSSNTDLSIVGEDYIVGRGIDNKIGGYILYQVAKELPDLDYTLHFVNAVQEEVGSRGGKMAAFNLDPNCSIVVDATHDTRPKDPSPTRCGDGPVIVIDPSTDKKLLNLFEFVAEEENIPLQFESISENGETDANTIAFEVGGTPTISVCVPVRYMHTVCEMIHMRDVDRIVKLLLAVLVRLK